ncbi:MAG: hypothetical protein ACTSSP_03305 [Candidatus Asgardarchaeia archaeon]
MKRMLVVIIILLIIIAGLLIDNFYPDIRIEIQDGIYASKTSNKIIKEANECISLCNKCGEKLTRCGPISIYAALDYTIRGSFCAICNKCLSGIKDINLENIINSGIGKILTYPSNVYIPDNKFWNIWGEVYIRSRDANKNKELLVEIGFYDKFDEKALRNFNIFTGQI